jgi:Ca2+-binding EF-hand superfamily protein
MQRFAEQCERVRTKMRTTHEESRNMIDAFTRYLRSRQQGLGSAYMEYQTKTKRRNLIEKYELDKLIARHHQACAPEHILAEFVKAPERSEEELTILQLEEETGENIFRIERALKYFKANDEDNSGYLDVDELRDVLCQLHGGVEPSSACMHRAMLELDSDGDGQISFYEFFVWYFAEFIMNKTDTQGKQTEVFQKHQAQFSKQQWTPNWLHKRSSAAAQ